MSEHVPPFLPMSMELEESIHYPKDGLGTSWRCSHKHYPNRTFHTNLWLIQSVESLKELL